jgi:hypothetical protein
MTKWMATLLGDAVDLRMLAEALTQNECRVVSRNNDFVLESTLFGDHDAVDVIRTKAAEVATLLSGASMVLLGATRRFGIGPIVHLDETGREHTYVTAEPAVASVRVLPAGFTVTNPDGSEVIHRPGDLLNEWFPLAVMNSSIAAVLRIRSRGPLDWDDLLRVIELIQTSGMLIENQPESPSKAEIRRLEQTANSVHALGERARHPGRDYASPKNPMDLQTARALVDRLTLAWLKSFSCSSD